MPQENQRKRIGIFVYPGVELLDFCGPYEVFTSVRLNEEWRYEEPSPFEVLLLSESLDTIKTHNGMRFFPDCTLNDCPALDILTIPGGLGIREAVRNEKLVRWIKERGEQAEWLTSVCTGAMLLGRVGLLDGKKAATHWRWLNLLQTQFPSAQFIEHRRVVEDGNTLTAAGVSAGIDMALLLTARLYGKDIAWATAKHIEYVSSDLESMI